MFSSRYSENELQQWQDACCPSGHAPRHDGVRASMAKGQVEKKQTRATLAMMQAQDPKNDRWASECLFDCYNG